MSFERAGVHGAIQTDVTEARRPDVTKGNPGIVPGMGRCSGVRCASSGLPVLGERFEVVRLNHFTRHHFPVMASSIRFKLTPFRALSMPNAAAT